MQEGEEMTPFACKAVTIMILIMALLCIPALFLMGRYCEPPDPKKEATQRFQGNVTQIRYFNEDTWWTNCRYFIISLDDGTFFVVDAAPRAFDTNTDMGLKEGHCYKIWYDGVSQKIVCYEEI